MILLKHQSDHITPLFMIFLKDFLSFWNDPPAPYPAPGPVWRGPAYPSSSSPAIFPSLAFSLPITHLFWNPKHSAAARPLLLLFPLPGTPFPQIFKQLTPSGHSGLSSRGPSWRDLPSLLPQRLPSESPGPSLLILVYIITF